MKPLQIGNICLDGAVTLAPMAGYGDRAFRRLCREYGAALTTTEMVSAKGLCYNSEKTAELLLLADCERPSCVQLFGSDPAYFARALELPLLSGFDCIDINMGCPVNKITKNGEGSALMLDEGRAAAIVEACVSAAGGRPVTVKFRLGYSESQKNAVAFAERMQRAGAAALTVHGRTTAQMYRGTADWNAIAAVAAAVTVPVIGNGDITNAGECLYRLQTSGCAGVAIGRGALGHPEIFREVKGGNADNLLQVILRHLAYMLEDLPEPIAVREMRKHLVWYLKGIPDAKHLRQTLNGAETADELRETLRKALQGENEC